MRGVVGAVPAIYTKSLQGPQESSAVCLETDGKNFQRYVTCGRATPSLSLTPAGPRLIGIAQVMRKPLYDFRVVSANSKRITPYEALSNQ